MYFTLFYLISGGMLLGAWDLKGEFQKQPDAPGEEAKPLSFIFANALPTSGSSTSFSASFGGMASKEKQDEAKNVIETLI